MQNTSIAPQHRVAAQGSGSAWSGSWDEHEHAALGEGDAAAVMHPIMQHAAAAPLEYARPRGASEARAAAQRMLAVQMAQGGMMGMGMPMGMMMMQGMGQHVQSSGQRKQQVLEYDDL